MDAEWDETPVLAAPAPFHPDPEPGGPPQASPDGHWWWDGRAWVPRPDPAEPAA